MRLHEFISEQFLKLDTEVIGNTEISFTLRTHAWAGPSPLYLFDEGKRQEYSSLTVRGTSRTAILETLVERIRGKTLGFRGNDECLHPIQVPSDLEF